MRETYGTAAVVATNGTAEACHGSSAAPSRENRGSFLPQWFSDMANTLWKLKAPAQLQYYTGTKSDRTPRAWVAADHIPSATVLAILLRSPEGWRVLKYIMRDSTETWWLTVQHGVRVADAIRRSEGE